MKLSEIYTASANDVLGLLNASNKALYIFDTPYSLYSSIFSSKDKLEKFDVDPNRIKQILNLCQEKTDSTVRIPAINKIIDALCVAQNIKQDKALPEPVFHIFYRTLNEMVELFENPDDIYTNHPELQEMLEAATSFMDPENLTIEELNAIVYNKPGLMQEAELRQEVAIEIFKSKASADSDFAFYLWCRDNKFTIAAAFASVEFITGINEKPLVVFMSKLASLYIRES